MARNSNGFLSTDTELIGFGSGKEYSGASGIYVDNEQNIISITGDVGKEYSGVNPIVVNNDENLISANSAPIGVQEPLYFVQDDDEAVIIGLSGEYVTPSDIAGKLDTSSFESWQQGQYTNDLTAINQKINEVSSSIPSLEGYATEQWVEDKGYLTEVSIPESATWEETSDAVKSNSGTWNTVTDKLDVSAQVISSCETSSIDGETLITKLNGNEVAVEYAGSARIANIALKDYQGNSFVPFYAKTSALENKLDTTAFSDVSGTFLTAHQSLEGYATETLVEETSGAITSLIPSTAGLASESYVQNNSAVLTGMIDGKQDTLTFAYDEQNKISAINNSAIASQGGGTTYTSPSGTILINGDELEASTSAIGSVVKTVNAEGVNSYFSAIPGYPFDTYSAQSTNMMKHLTLRYGDWYDGITVNDAMTANIVEIPLTSGGYDLWLYNGSNVRVSAVKSGVVELAKKDDLSDYTTIIEKNALSASISSVSSNLYDLSGKTVSGSKLGTIIFDGQDIEGSTSAVIQVADTATVGYSDTFSVNTMPNYPYSTYKFRWLQANPSETVKAIYGNWTYNVSFNYSPQGVTIPATSAGYDLTMVGYGEGVLSGIKSTVVELALKSELPTYEYDSADKISAINGSAIAVGITGEFVPQSSFNALKESYDVLSSLFATYSGQWLLPNGGI